MYKKLLGIALSVLMTFSTAGCSLQYANINTVPTGALDDPSKVDIELNMPYLADFASYSEYINTHSLPDDFIYYSALSDLGEFEGFTCWPFDYTEYDYFLTDANGYSLLLIIKHKTFDITEIETRKTLLSEENMTDLWRHPSGTSGYIVKNGCVFDYINGELLSIMWGSGNISFTMTIDLPANKETETNGKDTLVNRLLDIGTSTTAIAELQHISYNS